MAKSIVSIGYIIPGHDELEIDFRVNNSLMDADIILFSPTLPSYQHSQVNSGYFNGKVAYGDSGSFHLREDMTHWKKELRGALTAGKTVFYLLDEKVDFYLDTGQRSYSGTGRNQKTTVHFTPSDNYEIFPATIGVIHSAQGKEIISTGNPLFKEFFTYFKSYLSYKLYFEKVEKGTILFTGKDKNKIIGLHLPIDNGNLVLLPYIYYDIEEFMEEIQNRDGENEGYWTKKAIQFGKVLVSNLVKISDGLSEETEKTPMPLWAEDKQYKNSQELIIEERIEERYKQLALVQEEIEGLKLKLHEAQILKRLLYEQGKALEVSVTKALHLLGYKAENYNDGTLEIDQVILSPEGYRYIGECEGKDDKDIDISKFRQLMESMNADFHREEVSEKAFGILFGNPQRFKDFTQKCKIGAERERIALIKTQDLFIVASYLLENSDLDFQKACRDAIHNCLGKVVEFPNIPDSHIEA
jgi:hypothetical protein